MAEEYQKPVPTPSRDSQPYWEGLREGRLLIQQCEGCGKLRHYPRALCDACYSFEVRWLEASGKGKLHSWTVTHHAFNIGFKRELPITFVTVDLDEGVRMQAQLREPPAELSIGLPVTLRLERATEDLVLPYFVPG